MSDKRINFEKFISYIKKMKEQKKTFKFQEIEEIIGDKLPPAARRWLPFWCGSPKSNHWQAQTIVKAGFKIKANIKQEQITISRIQQEDKKEHYSTTSTQAPKNKIITKFSRDIKKTMKLIKKISHKLGFPINNADYYIEDLGCPHSLPKNLPKGYSGVYIFIYKDEFLKIGKANARSKSRYTSQHYGFNAKSSLAKSLFADHDFDFKNKEEVKPWILKNLHRINILVLNKHGKPSTELIEAILHYKYRPKYEGEIREFKNSSKEVD